MCEAYTDFHNIVIVTFSFFYVGQFSYFPICCDFWVTVCAVRPLSCLSCLSVTLVYCGQTVGWIKMKLGMEIGLGPDHIVLDGDPPPKRGKVLHPNFRPMSVVAKRLDGSRCHLVHLVPAIHAVILTFSIVHIKNGMLCVKWHVKCSS